MSTALHIINGIISVRTSHDGDRGQKFKSWNPEPSWASPLPDISTTTHHVVVDTATKVHDYVVIPTVPRPSYRTLWCLMCWGVAMCVWMGLNAAKCMQIGAERKFRTIISSRYMVCVYMAASAFATTIPL